MAGFHCSSIFPFPKNLTNLSRGKKSGKEDHDEIKREILAN